MPKQSSEIRNAKCRAKHRQKKENDRMSIKRIQNQQTFDAHWKNLENVRKHTRKHRQEVKRRNAQIA